MIGLGLKVGVPKVNQGRIELRTQQPDQAWISPILVGVSYITVWFTNLIAAKPAQ